MSRSAEHLRLQGLRKLYGDIEAVRGLDLGVARGEFLTLLGPSGCGKTTTLRLVAGFELPDAGCVFLSGTDITRAPPNLRPVNTVFQNYALFPHLSVGENVAFGLRMRGVGAAERGRRVAAALARVALSGFERRRPRQLSGGQQQRVALARALVNEPQILLLDEPLGALDLKLRRQMQVELKTLHRQVGITFLYVTHDQEEALAMSDRVAVMSAGRIEQIGPPEEIYERPRSRFVADFIGDTNLIDARVTSCEAGWIEARRVEVAREETGTGEVAGGIAFRARGHAPAGSAVTLSIRPERWRCGEESSSCAPNVYRARIVESAYAGAALKQVVELAHGLSITVRRPGGCAPGAPGTEVMVGVSAADVVVLPGEPAGSGN